MNRTSLAMVLGILVLPLGAAYFLTSGSSGPADPPAAARSALLAASPQGVAEAGGRREPRAQAAALPPLAFDGSRAEVERFMAYNRDLRLTREQEAVQHEALAVIPAPCCSTYSARTCCCPCNLARGLWGLAKHLIVERGSGAGEVRAAVEQWIETVNPSGYSGDACFTGRCGAPFRQGGCGGMSDGHLVF